VLDLKDYPDNSYVFILDECCFHCIIGEDRKLFLPNARRVLKPGGFLLVNTMCGEVTNEEMKNQFDAKTRCLISKEIASRYIGLAEDITDEIKEAGFHILHSEILSHKTRDEFDTLLVHAVKPK